MLFSFKAIATFLVFSFPVVALSYGQEQPSTVPAVPKSQSTVQEKAQPSGTAGEVAPVEVGGQWIQLFNGQDLTGWTPKIVGHPLGDNYGDTFRVVDGLLTVAYDKYVENDFLSQDGSGNPDFNKFGHLFYKDAFSHYLLRVEYRFVGDQVKNGPGWAFRNNGLMLHGQDPTNMAIGQAFPVSIEVQLLGGDGTHDRTTLNLCTPGTNVVLAGKLCLDHCTSSKSPTFHGDQWVTVEVEVRGNEIIRHRVGDQVVLEYSQPQYDQRDADARALIVNDELLISRGTISLQSESHGTQFRKIELQQLPHQ